MHYISLILIANVYFSNYVILQIDHDYFGQIWENVTNMRNVTIKQFMFTISSINPGIHKNKRLYIKIITIFFIRINLFKDSPFFILSYIFFLWMSRCVFIFREYFASEPAVPTENCDNQWGYFGSRSRSDCGYFFNCVDGREFLFTCPAGLAFSSLTYRCEYPDESPDCDADGK